MTLNKQQLTLNCDMGESFGSWSIGADEDVMPHVDMANIACGFHASDPNVMHDTITLANDNDVDIGAHPGYADLQGFGRRSISMTGDEITNMVIYQVGALQALCRAQYTDISYIKPHGALYNDMMKSGKSPGLCGGLCDCRPTIHNNHLAGCVRTCVRRQINSGPGYLFWLTDASERRTGQSALQCFWVFP